MAEAENKMRELFNGKAINLRSTLACIISNDGKVFFRLFKRKRWQKGQKEDGEKKSRHIFTKFQFSVDVMFFLQKL